jgi:hypothetical protein
MVGPTTRDVTSVQLVAQGLRRRRAILWSFCKTVEQHDLQIAVD